MGTMAAYANCNEVLDARSDQIRLASKGSAANASFLMNRSYGIYVASQIPILNQSCPASASPLLRVVEDVGQVAATAVLSVVHGGHEDTSTALYSLSAFRPSACV